MELLVILKGHIIGFYHEANAEDRPITHPQPTETIILH